MTVATRYANALYALAQEASQQPAVAAAVATLSAGLEDATLAEALTNPLLKPAQRASFAAAMAKSVKAPQALANTLGVLARANRLSQIPSVLSAYLDINDAAAGLTHVKLASAVALTDAQRTKLTAAIKTFTKANGIRLDETVDASLQGGFRAYFNGMVWDASLSSSLARLASRLRTAITDRHSQA